MSRLISLVVLLVVLTAVGAVFYQVMAGFLVPLFLAVLLVVMFRPAHQWYMDRCGGRGHLAAGLTTATILVAVLVPLGAILTQAALEGGRIVADLLGPESRLQQADAPPVAPEPTATTDAPAATQSQTGDTAAGLEQAAPMHRLIEQTVRQLGLPISPQQQVRIADDLVDSLEVYGRPLLVGGVQAVGRTLLGLIVMIVSIYFFLLDGPRMVDSIIGFIPLDPGHTQELFSRFVNVSRAIVTATLLSAVIQGILAGIAYGIAGLDSVFLLMSLTMLLAMIPFVGAVSVWLPCCLWLFFVHGDTYAAIGLGIFGTAVISQADNVIKPYVLHGQSNLHPLLALLSVLGGVQALGPIGIVVGPMAVAFLQTVLTMVRAEIGHFDASVAADHAAEAEEKAAAIRAVPTDARSTKSLRRLLKRFRMQLAHRSKKPRR